MIAFDLGPFFHLIAQRLDIMRDQVRSERQQDGSDYPGGDADGQDGDMQGVAAGDKTSQQRCQGSAAVFDEILDRQGSAAHFRKGDVIYRGNHIGGGEGDEKCGDQHHHQEERLVLDRHGEGDRKQDRTDQHAEHGDIHAPAWCAFK